MSSSKSRARSIFSLTCGCKDSKSVSLPILISDSSDKSTATTKTASTAKSLAVASTPSFSSIYEEDQDASSTPSTPSFSGLLRQLSELERKVIEWAPPANEKEAAQALQRQQEQHKVEESVAVVKESEDPLTDFRKSMLQMIVEKEILNGDELRELLSMFLQINSRRHHEIIVQAFAEIWKEVFAGYEDAPELFTRSN